MQLAVKDVSALLDVPAETVYRWVRQGGIPSHRVNDDIRFSRAELLEWAMARNVRISPDLFKGDAPDRAPFPTLAETLKPDDVAYRVAGADPASVLRTVIGLLRLPESVDRAFLYQMLSARENFGFVGIGGGVVVPHARNPVVLDVIEPVASLCFLENAVGLCAIDGAPVRVVFMLVCPTVRMHLHLLSRLCVVVRHAGFKAALARKVSAGELLSALAEAEAAICR